jgi:aryl-alcohol dehydrogenase-like predicted oxidoreductase
VIRFPRLGLGGHHLGKAEDEQTAVQIVHEAVDGGITFFDNCWEYNRGKLDRFFRGVLGVSYVFQSDSFLAEMAYEVKGYPQGYDVLEEK